MSTFISSLNDGALVLCHAILFHTHQLALDETVGEEMELVFRALTSEINKRGRVKQSLTRACASHPTLEPSGWDTNTVSYFYASVCEVLNDQSLILDRRVETCMTGLQERFRTLLESRGCLNPVNLLEDLVFDAA